MMNGVAVYLSGLVVAVGFSASVFAEQICDNTVKQTAPTSAFTVNSDGTVSDDFTGLMWMPCVQGLSGSACATGTEQAHTWQTALQAVTAVNADPAENYGYSDWRLPNIKELATITELQCHSPAANLVLFPATPMIPGYNNADPQQITVYSSLLWSSTPSSIYNSAAPSTGRSLAWGINFIDGGIVRANKDSSGYVRLVRN
ncbi:MAG TPA: DUF1566 domain-containing protein [Candidatus Tenderia electrophaga]|uniref:DUF1566 domain-containing protein n=1 Tax=Candidatus Tenderia electrophaga TaxID=1748243 RepID=A0A832N3H2_9GAMM|nr:DUF1566 domain-containing protein [Candidatus Tenderia electrophaga]